MTSMSDAKEENTTYSQLGGHKYTLLNNIVGRWNGEVRAIQVGSNSVLVWVWYLKIAQIEDSNDLSYRLITTAPDGTTRKIDLILSPVSDGRLSARAPHDEHLARCKIELVEGLPGPKMLQMTICNHESSIEQIITYRLGTAGATAFISVAAQLYSNEGFILSTESAVLRRCSPSEPVNYPMTSPTSPTPSEPTLKVEEADE